MCPYFSNAFYVNKVLFPDSIKLCCIDRWNIKVVSDHYTPKSNFNLPNKQSVYNNKIKLIIKLTGLFLYSIKKKTN